MSESLTSTSTFTENFSENVSSTISATVTSTATATATAGAEDQFVPPVVPSISITTPLIYLGVLIFTLVSFSIYHRRSKIKSLQTLTSSSLFTPAYEAEITVADELSTPTPDSTPALMYNDLKNSKAHEKLLKCALVERAAESMRRIIKIKESEPSVMLLYTRGLIGDDSFKRFNIQAKIQDAEMIEIAKEAESFKQGWSRVIFANAQEVMMNQALRRRVGAVSTRKETVEKLEIKGVESVISDIQQRVIELK